MRSKSFGFIVCLFATSIAWSETPDQDPKGVHIINLTASDAQIWVSGVEANLPAASGYQVPCFPGEILEVQYNGALTNITCGDVLEIDYER